MGDSEQQPKASFVHKKQERVQKGWAALLLLLLRGKKGPIALLVAALLVVFILGGAPFGWNLGVFASYIDGRPGLGWLARAARSADRLVFGRDSGASDPLYAASGGYGGDNRLYSGDFNAKAYRQQAADLARDGSDPGKMVAGGAALMKEAEAPAPKQASQEERVRQVDPDKGEASEAPVVDLGNRELGGAQQAMAELGRGAAYGGPSLFSGSAGAVNPRDTMFARAPDGFKDLKPTARTTDKRVKQGRITKFNGGEVASRLSGNATAKLIFGSKYRYRLALAFTQTDYAEAAQQAETQAIYSRAWSTGESADKVLGVQNEKLTTPPAGSGLNQGNINTAINGWQQGIQNCQAKTAEVSPKLDRVTTQLRALNDCLQNGCSVDEINQANMNLPDKLTPISAAWATNEGYAAIIARESKWIADRQNDRPDCCDTGAVNNWNHHVDVLNGNIDQFNRVVDKMQAVCGVNADLQSEMAASCGGTAMAADAACSQNARIDDPKARPEHISKCTIRIWKWDVCYRWLLFAFFLATTGFFATFLTMGLAGAMTVGGIAAVSVYGLAALAVGPQTINKFLDRLFTKTYKSDPPPVIDMRKSLKK